MNHLDVHIDPGFAKKNGALGWSAFDGPDLAEAGLVRREESWTAGKMGFEAALAIGRIISPRRIRYVLIERMQSVSFTRQQGDQNDLIRLSEVGGICAGMLVGMLGAPQAEIDYVTPHEWKGQVDGDIFTQRIIDALKTREAEIALAACKRDAPRAKVIWHNLYDGVGLGLFKRGRVGRR